MLTVLVGVLAFTGITLFFVSILMFARARLVPSGLQAVTINGGSEFDFRVDTGTTLLQALTEHGMLLPAACGGQGTCGACRVRTETEDAAILATEAAHISPQEARDGWRLACQVRIKDDIRIKLPPDTFNRGSWVCTVRSCRNVATFIRELILELPADEKLSFEAGSYIQIECPPHEVHFADFRIEEQFKADWDRFKLLGLRSKVSRPETRAYSMANYPGEPGIVMLNVRIATPPPGSQGVPPGKVSSYLFSVQPGDHVTVTGPFGDFFAKDTHREMLFIGGGAGMAPMRSHILDQLERIHTNRKITFWYGARSLREAFYVEEFEKLTQRHDNFEWHLALSEPLPEDNWQGPTGFVHQVVYDNYLSRHDAPEEVEYYLCGPPMMIRACKTMLYDLGVESENILSDEF